MKRITVFCGANAGFDLDFSNQAFQLGEYLAEQNIELVYGGAKIGLMGAVAEGVLKSGGRVIGVIPHFLLTKEVAHDALTELIVVESMHQRKAKMDALSDGVIALPGGFGTLEELFEMLTWSQLGLHGKPIAIFNIKGFYNHLIGMMNTMVEKGYLSASNLELLLIGDDKQDILEKMKNYKAPSVAKWITDSTL